MIETFGLRLRRMRKEINDPGTGRPITQQRLSELIGLNRHAIYRYENEVRVPHPLVRRELERVFPRLFKPDR